MKKLKKLKLMKKFMKKLLRIIKKAIKKRQKKKIQKIGKFQINKNQIYLTKNEILS